MTTIRQLIQTSPMRANELFAKLVDTSDNAVKTRERLFTELKDELELLADLEEQHLFPVLKKHKQTKDLMREALNDNKQARKVLAELHEMPKDGEAFAIKIVELKRLFQQHVRDEKKELLPAVLKALSDEEADAIVERIEGGKAEIEEAKRAETEQRRAEARQQREQEQAVQRSAESLADIVQVGGEGAQKLARTTQETVHGGFSVTSEAAQRMTDQIVHTFSLAGPQTQGLAPQSVHAMEVISQTTTVFARGLQEISRECFALSQERLQRNVEGLSALAQSRSLPEFFALQSELMRDNLQRTIDNSQRVIKASVRVAEEAAQATTEKTSRMDVKHRAA